MIRLPRSVATPEMAVRLLSSLDAPERRFLLELGRLCAFPRTYPPPALVGYVQSSRLAYGGIGQDWDHPRFRRLFSSVTGAFDSAGYVSYGRDFVRYLCASLAYPSPAEVRRPLLDPLRIIVSVPSEWRPVVAEALPNLGLERALALPGLTAPV